MSVPKEQGHHASRRRRVRPSRHLLDRLAVVRSHLGIAVLAFLLVVCSTFIYTLRSTPTFEASATLQLVQSYGAGNIVADLAALGKPSAVETEREVMRSFSVARGAAIHVAGLQGADATPSSPLWPKVRTLEINAYRPWEVLLRGVGHGPPPCRIDMWTDALPEDETSERYTFAFDVDGGGVTVTALHLDEPRTRYVDAVSWDDPFEVMGREFRIAEPSGDPAGRRYSVRVESIESAAERLLRRVTVSPVGRFTDVLQITYEDSTPYLAQMGANALADSYMSLRQRRQKDRLSVADAWLTEEIARLTRESRDKVASLNEWVREHDAVHLSERTTSLLERIVNLEQSLADTQRKKDEHAWLLARYRAAGDESLELQLVILGPDGVNSVTAALAGMYSDLLGEIAMLETKGFTSEVEIMREKEAELAAIRKEIEGYLILALQAQIEVQEREIEAAEKHLDELDSRLAEQRAELDELPPLTRELAIKTEEVESTRRLLERRVEEQMSVQSASSSNDIAVLLIDAARMPTGRSSPSLFRNGLVALLLGFVVAVGSAFFLDYLDRKIRSPQELVEGLGLTLYGSIPAYRSVRRKDRAGRGSAMVTVEKPSSVISEAYRTLRANIRFANREQTIQTLAITSALPQEGKTVTTCNLGVVLAQARNKTIIVDADMRRPATHLHFEGERCPGLTDVLTEKLPWEEAVRATEIEHLAVIHSGVAPANPGALLDSSQFQSLLEQLREAYEYVLVDMPPVLAVADAASFFGGLDGVLLIARCGRCTLEVVDGARGQIERLGGNVLGVILNDFDVRRTARRRYAYYGYHGYYSRPGEDDAAAVTAPQEEVRRPPSTKRGEETELT